MGWDLSNKWERKQWKKERRKLAEKMGDMDLSDVYGPQEIERINRVAGRLSGKGRRAPAAPAPPATGPPTPQLWPVPPGEYGRWGAGNYGNWANWYAPGAQVADQPHLKIINDLLPYMAAPDAEALARQLYTAGGGAQGAFRKYLGASGPGGAVYGAPSAPGAGGGTYEKSLEAIEGIIGGIPDPTAQGWAKAVFDTYRDYTQATGMRGTEDEQMFKAHLDELFASVPESAQPYAAALQRLVVPTVARPAQEWYEMRAPQRTAPTNWSAMGLTQNPAWM